MSIPEIERMKEYRRITIPLHTDRMEMVGYCNSSLLYSFRGRTHSRIIDLHGGTWKVK
jgi:hypothetical protein